MGSLTPTMAGLHMALLVLVGSASAIERWTLGDLGGSLVGPSKVYDDLDTDVSIARRPEHSARSSAPKKEPVLPHWEEADLTRRYEEQQKMNAHRCRNFMGREVPCSGPPSIVHPGQIHPGLLPSETVELGSNQKKMCETPGCIGVSHMLLDNMDQSVSPCDDFYQFVCGGFEERVAIPDDRSAWSQFSVIDKELQQQLRALLETPPPPSEANVFKKVRSVYSACMNTPLIEQIGLQPLKDKLKSMVGWFLRATTGLSPSSTGSRRLTSSARTVTAQTRSSTFPLEPISRTLAGGLSTSTRPAWARHRPTW